MIVLTLLAICDLAAGWVTTMESGWASQWYGPVHLALSVAALAAGREATSARSERDGLAVSAGAAFGPCGILVLLLVRPWSWLAMGYRVDYPSAPSGPDGPPQLGTSLAKFISLVDERIQFPTAGRIQSLSTILRHGDLPARSKALEAAVRSFEPRLSTLVAMGLTDQDQTIRAIAAAAAAQISSNLADRLAKLHACPSDDLENRHVLAMLMADHGCNNVLFPQSQRRLLCQQAQEHLTWLSRCLPAEDGRRQEVSDALTTMVAELGKQTTASRRTVRLHTVDAAT